MRRVDSQALGQVGPALGLFGRGVGGETVFDDGTLYQIVDVNQLVRRARTQAGTYGIYRGEFSNVHAAANTQSSQLDPYNPGDNAIAPYPAVVSVDYDVWLLGATIRQTAGGGTFEGLLTLGFAGVGWTVNQAGGAPAATTADMPVVYWDSAYTPCGVGTGLTEQGQPWHTINVRVPRRSTSLVVFYSTSSAAATFVCQVLLGLFPSGLGQDAAL